MIDNWHHSSHYGFEPGPSSPSYSSCSSTRSSHLSILTTTSSISSALSSTSTSSEHADQPPLSPISSGDPSSSNGNKTNAFFASPFSSTSFLPPEPSMAPLVATTSASSSSTTSDAEITPRMQYAPAPMSKKLLNDSFFSPPWPTAPLPPSEPADAVSSLPPPTSAPASITDRIPLLSRVFPSRVRYTTVDALPSREGSPHGHHPTLLSFPPRTNAGRRQLVELDPVEHHADIEAAPMLRDRPMNTHSPEALDAFIPPMPSSRAIETGSSEFPTPLAVPNTQVPQLVQSPMSMTPPATVPAPVLRPGTVIIEPSGADDQESDMAASSKLQLVLMKTLGQGAFSSVWLARDETGRVGRLEVVRKNSLKKQRSKQGSLRRSGTGSIRRRANRASEGSEDWQSGLDRAVEGTVPKIRVPSESTSDGRLGIDGAAIGHAAGLEREDMGRVVALKMTDRALCDRDDRTRVSFIREVEVLKHISHPSIVSYIHAFSTTSHHILVLEHVPGGELFDLVSSQETHARLDEPLLRRIFGELCRAVGWMHAVGLVHRDIKLENILLTRNAFADPGSPAPLVKLTDFGLSRFVDPDASLLTTRCGSESYAAPELVTGRPYDGRETDAWACGVVLYALVTRRLPFDAMNPTPEAAVRSNEQGVDQPETRKVRGPRRDEKSERRALLMRIAKAEYTWPDLPELSVAGAERAPLRGLDLARSDGVKRVVGRLLVRDPRKRAKVAQLWDDAWLSDEGAPPAPVLPDSGSGDGPYGAPVGHAMSASITRAWDSSLDGSESWDEDVENNDDDDDEGVLVDEQDIGPGSVARQELIP